MRYCSLTFPDQLVKEPIFYRLVKKSGLTVNIFKAKVTGGSGWLVLALSGEESAIEEALLELKMMGAFVVKGGEEILAMTDPPPMSAVKIRLVAPRPLIKEPILANLINEFDVIINIRQAAIDDEGGRVDMELSGALSDIDQAIESLRRQKVEIEPIEGNVIE